jgi:hypothetical protein
MWMLTGPDPTLEGATRPLADCTVETTEWTRRSGNRGEKLAFHRPVDKMGIAQRDRQYA